MHSLTELDGNISYILSLKTATGCIQHAYAMICNIVKSNSGVTIT